jgi:tetratricopeptide (TPR) repeat protein
MSRLEQLEKLRAADPTDSDVPYMIAHEKAKAGALGESVEWYNRCLELDPDYLYAYFHKAKTLESLDQPEIAAAALEEGLGRAKRAGNAKAIGELGEYLTQLQDRLREESGG